MKVAVIGAGAWGGALAQVLADNQHTVYLWSRNQEDVDYINQHHVIQILAKKGIEHELPTTITASTKLAEIVSQAEVIIMAVPSYALRAVSEQVNALLQKPTLFVTVTKGLEPKTKMTMAEVVEDVLNPAYTMGVVALTGPSHAEEVIKRKITAVVSACVDIKHATTVQKLFNNQTYFRVYANEDRKGAEIGGALKNIIAILSGMVTEYDLGDNARAALITRGLFEMVKIGVALGGQERTFSGLAGLGDLIVTTTSENSRNFQAGRLLAKGMKVQDIENFTGATVEGIHAVNSAHEITTELNIYSPLIDLLYDVVTEKITAEQAISLVVDREMKDEFRFDE